MMDLGIGIHLVSFFLGCVIGLSIEQTLRSRLLKTRRHPTEKTRRKPPERSSPLSVGSRERECEPYKDLYLKLHHLEQHANVLPQAKALLLSFFSEALQSERAHSAILSIDRFSVASLDGFVKAELDAVTEAWHEYLVNRQAGQPRELFQDADDARRWLVRMAPVKLVDGAWLGHIHKVSTPFSDRRFTRAAWQILSEELGDGDLTRNHAYLYAQLLERVGAHVASPDSVEFIRHPDMHDAQVWRSALAQLLISLFPHEFLPEILGFNLHFEMLTYETLVLVKELREVGFDPYYFTLHVTIDNADSGHTAMASRIVTEYLLSVAAEQGDTAASRAWKRVQAGFILSKNLPSDMSTPTGSPLDTDVLAIFQAKTTAANRIHGNCSMSFGARSLDTWLDPEAFARAEWQTDFLRCLSKARPWVYKGDSKRSRLIHLLSWGGSMFGAFTDREVAILRNWIDSLAPPGSATYRVFTERMDLDELPPQDQSLRLDHTVFPAAFLTEIDILATESLNIDVAGLQMHKLLPLWFAHPCLLERFTSVPWRTASPIGCAIVRILRSQHGFQPEPEGVAGIDEMRRTHVDLVDMGIEMLTTAGISSSLPATLAEVLQRWPSPFAEMMLATSMRPEEQGWKLLGMARAFTQLHTALACSDRLSRHNRQALGLMAAREEKGLSDCIEGLDREDERYGEFREGFKVARQQIRACF